MSDIPLQEGWGFRQKIFALEAEIERLRALVSPAPVWPARIAALEAENERLRESRQLMQMDARTEAEKLRADNERLRAELREWEECARYDPDMSGRSLFKGWDRSALDRCRRKVEERKP